MAADSTMLPPDDVVKEPRPMVSRGMQGAVHAREYRHQTKSATAAGIRNTTKKNGISSLTE